MSNKIPFIDQIAIRKPCSIDWDSRTGKDEVRFCEERVKSVHDPSSMNRARSIYKLSRDVTVLAAIGLAVALTVCGSVNAQQAVIKLPLSSGRLGNSSYVKSDQVQEKRMFAGRVVGSPDDSPISGATVTLKGLKSGNEYSTTSDKSGFFCIDGLGVERYDASMKAINFKSVVIKGLDTSINVVTKVWFATVAGNPNEQIVKQPIYDYRTLCSLVPDGIWLYGDKANQQAFYDFENGKISARKLDKPTKAAALDSAVGSNRINAVRSLLAAGAKVNFAMESAPGALRPTLRNTTVLFSITSVTGAIVIDELLRAGADFTLKNYSNESLVIFAARIGNTVALKDFIRFGLGVNEADEDGLTPLMYAVFHDDFEAVKSLISAGANPNFINTNGFTALSVALNSMTLNSTKTRDIIRFLKPLTATE